MRFAFTTTTLVALTPPNCTVDPAEKFEPEMLTLVPPDSGPEFGVTEVTTGTADGLLALKLSTARVPAATGSAVAVPMRTSNLTELRFKPLLPFQLVHGSWYWTDQVPGRFASPALAGAVSNTTLP